MSLQRTHHLGSTISRFQNRIEVNVQYLSQSDRVFINIQVKFHEFIYQRLLLIQ